jgi:uncharacterized protein (DUF362 family)
MDMEITNAGVAICKVSPAGYPSVPPFHPCLPYPELTSKGFDEAASANLVYDAVRNAFTLLGLDLEHIGSPVWNPLGRYIQPGSKIVLKPNFVLHEFGPYVGTNCLTTHGSVIRAVVDYVFLAGGPESSIIIADAPLQGADFDRILRNAGIPQIQEYYWKKFRYEIKAIDLRRVRAIIDERSSLIKKTQELPGDPLGYTVINLGKDSRLSELDRAGTHYVVGDYNIEVTNTRHRPQVHEYVVSNTILEADTLISLPKLKTHSKTGITVALKNVVGIIGSKDCLPHHRYGKAAKGGDEFAADYPLTWYLCARVHGYLQGKVSVPLWRGLRRMAEALFGAGTPMDRGDRSLQTRFYSSGGWYGNDTIWRTVDDLNRILFLYNTASGNLETKPQRRFFAVVDGIIGMEGNGPLRGVPKPCGIIIAGDDPLTIDVIAASLMGFDWKKIRLLRGTAEYSGDMRYSSFSRDDSEINIASNIPHWTSMAELKARHLGFIPPAGWRGHVEVSHVD